MATTGSAGYLELLPQDVLRFALSPAGQTRTTLKLTNTSDHKVAFKVKTTSPQRYFVRPNQGVLAEDSSEVIQIILAEKHCKELLIKAAKGTPESNSDRFLVLSIGIDDATFDHISGLPTEAKADELTKLWEQTKKEDKDSRREKRGKKLAVEYDYPDDLQEIAGKLMESTEPAQEVREAVSQPKQAVGAPGAAGADASRVEKPGSYEAMFAELQATRKKYDAVVEYTLTLTAERDMLSNKLEELQREHTRLRNRAGVDADGGRLRSTSTADKAQQAGFQLFHLCLCALIFFLLGKFLRLD